MVRILRKIAPAAALFLSLAATPRASAGTFFESPEDLWEHYCKMVGLRDEVEVLACYDEKLRQQLSGDKTSAGRARLGVHMGELFELLFKDYDYKVEGEKREGDSKLTYTIRFKHRRRSEEHTSDVVMTSDGDRWSISKHPEGPDFLKASSGSTTMMIGIAVAILAIGIVAKKILA